MLRKKTLFLTALVLFFCFAPQSYAAEQWKIPRTNYYLTAEQQRILFPAPPVAGGKDDMADLDAVREWEKKRTNEQCANANAEAKADVDSLFGAVSPFPKPMPDEAAAVLKRIKMETDGIAADIKDRYKRPRPFLRDTSFNPCLGKIGGDAYPSGHATISRMYALIFSDLVPGRRAGFMARADEVALYRVIGGVHHPSDIEAGKRLAEILYPLYMKSPAFRKELKILRGCLVLPKRSILPKALNSKGP